MHKLHKAWISILAYGLATRATSYSRRHKRDADIYIAAGLGLAVVALMLERRQKNNSGTTQQDQEQTIDVDYVEIRDEGNQESGQKLLH